MKKLVTSALVLTMGVVSLMSAESTNSGSNSDANLSSASVKEKTGEGVYVGLGIGSSLYNVNVANATYNYSTGTSTVNGSQINELDDSDVGYLLYGGYQFNKIIAVEGSYTDYGSFSSTVNGKDYSMKPRSFAVYANAGYTFLNGQLRPFGLLGLGYLLTNQSATYDQLNGFDDSIVTLHTGLGIDYYPTKFEGFGFRAAYTNDTYYDNSVKTYNNTVETSTSMWQYYSLFYIGVQYKF